MIHKFKIVSNKSRTKQITCTSLKSRWSLSLMTIDNNSRNKGIKTEQSHNNHELSTENTI